MLSCSSTLGHEPSISAGPQPQVGWLGSYVVGRWTEVVIDFDAAEAGDYETRVTAPDPDGNRVTFSSSTRLARGRHPLRGFFKVGQMDPRGLLNPEIGVDVVDVGSGKSVWSSHSSAQPPLDSAVRLIVTVGNAPGFDWNDAKQPAAGRAFLSVDVFTMHLEISMQV